MKKFLKKTVKIYLLVFTVTLLVLAIPANANVKLAENAKSEAFFREFITSSHPKDLILGKPHFQLKTKQNDKV